MAVVVIDTIKPKNNGTFPVVEAADVKVTNDKRLDAALNDKANQSDLSALSNTVSGKADKTALAETNAALTTKASNTDLAETNAAVALKANTADVNAALALKADTADITAIDNRVDDVETEQDALSARMDTFTQLSEGSTTGDAELADIRVGADGTTYANAGTSVRTQITNVNNNIDNVKNGLIYDKSIELSKLAPSVSAGCNIGEIDLDVTSTWYNSNIQKRLSLFEVTLGTYTPGTFRFHGILRNVVNATSFEIVNGTTVVYSKDLTGGSTEFEIDFAIDNFSASSFYFRFINDDYTTMSAELHNVSSSIGGSDFFDVLTRITGSISVGTAEITYNYLSGFATNDEVDQKTYLYDDSISRFKISPSAFVDQINHKIVYEATSTYSTTIGKVSIIRVDFADTYSGSFTFKATLKNVVNATEFQIMPITENPVVAYSVKIKDNREFNVSCDLTLASASGFFIRFLNGENLTMSAVIDHIEGSLGDNDLFEETTDWSSAISVGSLVLTNETINGIATTVGNASIAGKNILYFGDSITDCTTQNQYPYYVANKTHSTMTNYAVGASGFDMNAYYSHPVWGQENTSIPAMIERAHTAGIKPDFIVVAGGTNDWNFGKPLGTEADILLDSMDTPTFYYAVALAIKKLFAYYPVTNYLFVIPTPRYQLDGAETERTPNRVTQKTLLDYCAALRYVLEYYHIPYLDMMKCANMHLESETARTKYTRDGLHPTEYYAENIFAKLVIEEIGKYI